MSPSSGAGGLSKGNTQDGADVAGPDVGIPVVAGDVDVPGLRAHHERVGRQMGLDDAPVGLSQHHLANLRRHDAHVPPGGDVADPHGGIAMEHELADDLLGPGGARFGVGADHDVPFAEREVVPESGIHVVVVDVAGLPREVDHGVHGAAI